MKILEVKQLYKSFDSAPAVLRAVDLQMEKGEFLGTIGWSGAGKSTLLRCINRLIEPTAGESLVPRSIFLPQDNGARVNILTLKRRELRLLRSKVGMVFPAV